MQWSVGSRTAFISPPPWLWEASIILTYYCLSEEISNSPAGIVAVVIHSWSGSRSLVRETKNTETKHRLRWQRHMLQPSRTLKEALKLCSKEHKEGWGGGDSVDPGAV